MNEFEFIGKGISTIFQCELLIRRPEAKEKSETDLKLSTITS